jgi:sodium/bile acid cotransporter 7
MVELSSANFEFCTSEPGTCTTRGELPLVRSFLVQRWFLLALVAVLAIGITCSVPLEKISTWKWLRDGIVAVVMFCMSLPLEARTMWQAMRKPGPPLLAIGITYGILPVFAWCISWLLQADLGLGLLVAASTPCTLASASVWTRRAGGNDAISTLVTILTNATCFFVTPLWLLALTGKSVGIENPDLSFAKMTTQLGLLVVLPIVIAQCLRRYQPLAEFATGRRMEFGVLAQCGILAMVFLGAIRTGLKLHEQSQTASVMDLVAMVLAVLGVHVAMFWCGVTAAKFCGFSRADQIAVGFSGSQKTLMVGLLMAITLKVSILPMVAYHCLQLFVDTLIADGYRKHAEQAKLADSDVGRVSGPVLKADGPSYKSP